MSLYAGNPKCIDRPRPSSTLPPRIGNRGGAEGSACRNLTRSCQVLLGGVVIFFRRGCTGGGRRRNILSSMVHRRWPAAGMREPIPAAAQPGRPPRVSTPLGPIPAKARKKVPAGRPAAAPWARRFWPAGRGAVSGRNTRWRIPSAGCHGPPPRRPARAFGPPIEDAGGAAVHPYRRRRHEPQVADIVV